MLKYPHWWLWTFYLAAVLTDDDDLSSDLIDEAIVLQGGEFILSSWFPPESL